MRYHDYDQDCKIRGVSCDERSYHARMATASSPASHEQPQWPPFLINVVAGGGAGLVETTATYPLDLARTRVQMRTGPGSPTVLTVLLDVSREQGVLSLYRGLLAPLVSEVPRRALKFSSNDFFKALLVDDRGGLSVAAGALAGGLTGATESVFHNPFEVVKVRLQSKEFSHLRNTWDCLQDMVGREGLASLYRGFEAYVLRQVVWNGAFFGLIGWIRQVTAHQHQHQQDVSSTASPSRSAKMLQEFQTGLVAGSVATCLNTPLDVAKTRLQVWQSDGRPLPWSIQVVRRIHQEEGFRACFKGLNARLYRAAPGSGLLVLAHDQISRLLKGNSG